MRDNDEAEQNKTYTTQSFFLQQVWRSSEDCLSYITRLNSASMFPLSTPQLDW